MPSSRDRTDGRSLLRFLAVSGGKCLTVVLLAACLASSGASRAFAADKSPEVLAAVRKAIDYLQKNLQAVAQNEAGLVAYTCLSAGEPADSPLVTALLDKIQTKFGADGYLPTFHHNYEAGVDAMIVGLRRDNQLS